MNADGLADVLCYYIVCSYGLISRPTGSRNGRGVQVQSLQA